MTKETTSRPARRQQLAVLGRVLGYMVRHYKFSCLVVVVCILGSALATLAGTLFMQSLIDDYILPLTQAAQPDFGPLAAALGRLAAVYVLGILCAYGYNRIMVNVSQGTMRNLRQELFQHMESLPLRYFDTHAHGDIMSVYTNDVDTLRQLISQGIPQIINSLLSLVTALVAMFALSVPLSLLTVAVLVGMVQGGIQALSRSYFGKLIPREKIRGKQRAMRVLVEKMVSYAEGGMAYDGPCHISHADNLADAEQLAGMIEEKFPQLRGRIVINTVGTTLGSHCGPGMVALFFYGTERGR